MKKYTEPCAHQFLDEIMATVGPFNEALITNNLPALSELYRIIGPLYRNVVPYIKTNKALAATASYIADNCLGMGQELATGCACSSLKDMAAFVQTAAIKATSAMQQRNANECVFNAFL